MLLESKDEVTSFVYSPPWCQALGFLREVSLREGDNYITSCLWVLKAEDNGEKFLHQQPTLSQLHGHWMTG